MQRISVLSKRRSDRTKVDVRLSDSNISSPVGCRCLSDMTPVFAEAPGARLRYGSGSGSQGPHGQSAKRAVGTWPE